jgi:uncharacterized integral membrane protein
MQAAQRQEDAVPGSGVGWCCCWHGAAVWVVVIVSIIIIIIISITIITTTTPAHLLPAAAAPELRTLDARPSRKCSSAGTEQST